MGVDGAGRGFAEPILEELIRQAFQGSVVHNDDTGMRILKLVRNTDDGRTGTFTSGIVSIWWEWRIALYFTGWQHPGENLADVLKQRAAERDAPIQRCDALSRNTPKLPDVEVLLANCLAHGRRQVVDVAANFPEECRYVLETLGKVYETDALSGRWIYESPRDRLLHANCEVVAAALRASSGDTVPLPRWDSGKGIDMLFIRWHLRIFTLNAGH